MAIRQLGIQMVVRGAERFARDISHVALSMYNYSKAVNSAEKSMIRLASSTAKRAETQMKSQERVVARTTDAYWKQAAAVSNLITKINQMQSAIALKPIATDAITRLSVHIAKLKVGIADVRKAMGQTDNQTLLDAYQKKFDNLQFRLSRSVLALNEWKQKLRDAQKAEKDIGDATDKLDDSYTNLENVFGKLGQETETLTQYTDQNAQAQQSLQDILGQSGGVLSTISKYFSVLTGKFGENIVGATKLDTVLLKLGLQGAALGVALNGVVLVLDAIAIVVKLVVGAVGLIINAFGKLLSIAVNVGKAIGNYILKGLKAIAALPFKIVAGGLNSIWQSLKRIGEIAIGMNISNLIWHIGAQIKDVGAMAVEAAGDFQLMQIRLRGLVQRELAESDASLDFADSLAVATQRAQELSYWVSNLAVKSIFSAEDINNTLTLAMAYDFTSQEAQDLTESIINFSTGMGLTDEQMRRIIENFGQMKAAGKAAGTELRDLARGSFVPVNKVFELMNERLQLVDASTNNIGEIRTKIQTMISEGSIDINEFFKSFIELSGTAFPNAIERSQTAWNVVKSNIQDFIQSIIGWRVITPTLDLVSERLTSFIASMMTPEARSLAENLGSAFAFVAKGIFRVSDALSPTFLKHFDKYIGYANSMLKSLKSFATGGKSYNETFVSLIGSFDNMGLRGKNIQAISKHIINLTQAFSNLVSGKGDIKETLTTIKDEVSGLFTLLWNELIVPQMKKIWEEKLLPKLKELWGFITGFVTDLWENKIPAWWEETGKPALLGLIAKLVEWVTESDDAKEIGKKITNGIVAGIQAAKDSGFLAAVSEILQTVLISAATAGVQALIGILSGGGGPDQQAISEGSNRHAGTDNGEEGISGIAGAIDNLKTKAQDALDSSLSEFFDLFEQKYPALFQAGDALAVIATAIWKITSLELENLKTIVESMVRISDALGGPMSDGATNLDSVSQSMENIVKHVSPISRIAFSMEKLADALERMNPTALDFLKNIPEFITNPGALASWAMDAGANLLPGITGTPGEAVTIDVKPNVIAPDPDMTGLQALFENIKGSITGLFTPMTESATTETGLTELQFQTLSDRLVGQSIIPDMMTAIYEVMTSKFTELYGWVDTSFVQPFVGLFTSIDFTATGQRIVETLRAGLEAGVPDLLAWWATIKAQFQITASVSFSYAGKTIPSGGSAFDLGAGKTGDTGDVVAAKGANFVVPPGYPNDTFRMRVSSGEQVIVIPNAVKSIQSRSGYGSLFSMRQNVMGGMNNQNTYQSSKTYQLNVSANRQLESLVQEYEIMRLLGE